MNNQRVAARNDGLTHAEGITMDALCNAAVAFARLPPEHPSELSDFIDAIHRCQDLLAVRIARRHYPEGWPTNWSALTAEATSAKVSS